MSDVVTHYSVDAYTQAAEDFWKRESRAAERRAKKAERTLREMRSDDDTDPEMPSSPTDEGPTRHFAPPSETAVSCLTPITPAKAGPTKGEPNGSV